MRGYARVFRQAFHNARNDRIADAAAALAYYGFTSLPAILLASLGAFGLLAGRNAVDTLEGKLREVAPEEAVSLVATSLDRVVENRTGGLVMLAVGVVLALWTATAAMTALMRGLNVAYGREETRGFVRQRLTALVMLALAAGAFLLVLGLLVLGPHLSRWIGSAAGVEGIVSWLWWLAQWPLLVAALFVAFGGILDLGPDREREDWKPFTLGAATAAALWLAASGLFSAYVSQFGSYNKTWGSLSAVIVTLVWLWLGALALLFGAEVNAEIERERAGEAPSAPFGNRPVEERTRV